MRRTQDNGIHFGEDNELRLIREMFEEQPSHGVYEGYRVEGNSQSVQFTPEQLAELRAAIDEMLRMAEQHRDALTDGAGEPDPAPDEAELRGLDLAILRGLDEQGEALLSIGDDPGFVWESNGNRSPYTDNILCALRDRGLVALSTTDPFGAPGHQRRFRLTGKGRARLAQRRRTSSISMTDWR